MPRGVPGSAKRKYTRRAAPDGIMGPHHRLKIVKSNILNTLIANAQGKLDPPLTSTQAMCGVALMRKVMPDLQAVEHTGEITQSFVVRMPETAQSVEAWQHSIEHGPVTSPLPSAAEDKPKSLIGKGKQG